MTLDLSKLRSLCEQAIPGPLVCEPQPKMIAGLFQHFQVLTKVPNADGERTLFAGDIPEPADAEFIAASREAVPQLLNALEVAEESLREILYGEGATVEGVFVDGVPLHKERTDKECRKIAREALVKIRSMTGEKEK